MKTLAAAIFKRTGFAILFGSLVIVGGGSDAASVLESYTSQSAFTGALSDSFNSTAAMSTLSLGPATGPLSFSEVGFGFSVDSTSTGADNLYVTDALSGSNRYLTPGAASDSLVVSSILPAGGATAFGGVFFATDIVEQFVSSEVELLFTFTNSQTVSHSFTPSSLASGTFYGIVADTPISSVSVASATPNLFATFGSGIVGLPATVGDLYWTADGTAAGGTGTWGSGELNWSSSATPAPASVRAWNQESRGVFAGAAGTVTIDSSGVSANAGLLFETDISLEGGSLTLGGTTAAENVITTANGVTATIAAARVGASDVDFTGEGVAVLGAASTASGATSVTGGTLRLAHSDGLSASATTIAGGRLEVAVDATVPTLNVDQGTILLDSTTSRVLTLDDMAVAETGLVDLGKGRINIGAGGISAADLRGDIIAGRDGGTWGGTSGITSSVAAADPTLGVGYVVDDFGASSVGLTANGDTNLDGLVNFDDILALFPYYDAAGDYIWQQGDFTYDGLVNFDDILALFPNYGTSSLTGGSAGGSASSVFGADSAGQVVGAVTPVPEPGALSLAACGLVLLGAWRAKNRSRR